METLVYTNKYKINQKISLVYIILEEYKTIKKSLEMDKINTVYIRKM